jgi:ATP-binding cassette subfamily C protein CydD
MSTTTSQAGDALLADAALPGRRSARLAAATQWVGTVATITQWAGVALLVGAAAEKDAQEATFGATWLIVGGFGAAVCALLSERGAAVSGARIADALRTRVLASALRGATRAGADPEPARVARAAIELADDIGDYHALAGPLHRSAPISMLTVLVAVAIVHWPAAIVLGLATLVVPANMWLAGMLAKEGEDRAFTAMRLLGATILDSFRGLGTLQRLGATRSRQQTIESSSSRASILTMSVLERSFISSVVMGTVITLSMAVVATYVGMTLLGYVRVPGVAPLTLAAGLFVLLLCPMYFLPLRRSAAAFHDRERAQVAAEELAGLFGAQQSASVPVAAPADTAWGITIGAGVVRHGSPGLNIDSPLTAEAGRWTAVLGTSGSGKSTLLRVAAGLRATAGAVVRWRSGDAECRPAPGTAAWIGQTTLVIDASLLDNIRLAQPDATVRQVRNAIELVGLTPTLSTMPQGIETICGRGGWSLSSGEQRRVAVARAVLRGAQVWILDEPTAHLDEEAARDLTRTLIRVTSGSTVLVATHDRELALAASGLWIVSDGIARHALVYEPVRA